MKRSRLLFSVGTALLLGCTSGAPHKPLTPANPADPVKKVESTEPPKVENIPTVTPPAAAPAPKPAKKITSVEGITEYELENGLRVLLFPDPSQPTTTVNITYFVGSLHEGYGETGMAHLLEHLLFKGSKNHTDISKELTNHGAFPNGTTWYDRTNYFETVTATDENLDWALDLEADRMVNSFVAKKDLDSEMTVVRNEFESGENDAFGVLMERVISTAFLWHNYGNSTIGARSDIENVPIERLQAFYRKYYQPDNAMLVVAGKFDEKKTLANIEKKFGVIPKPVRSLEKGNLLFPTYTRDPVQDGERSVTVKRVGDTQYAMLAYHIPAVSHEDAPAIEMLSYLFGYEPGGRLYKALNETKKAAGSGSFTFTLKEPGVFLAFAQVRKEGKIDDAKNILIKAIEESATKEFPAEEIERARTALLKDIEMSLNSSEEIGLALTEWAAGGDWRLFFLHRDRLKKVTSADIKRVASTYLKATNRTLGIFQPTDKIDRAEIPAAPDIAALLKDYKGGEAVALGEDFDPSNANIDKRTTTATLSNGMKIATLPKESRGDVVFVELALRFAKEEDLTNKNLGTIAGLTGRMLMKGTSKRTRQQLQDEFDKLKARVVISGGTQNAYASIETTRANLPATLKLAAEILREPVFDAKELDLLKEERLAFLEQQRSEPGYLVRYEMTKHLDPWPKGHPFYMNSIDEEIAAIKAVKQADLKKFHKDFYGVSDMSTIAIVGDFDAKETTALVESLFTGWKTPKPFVRIPRSYKDIEALNKNINTPDKANATLSAKINVNISTRSEDYPAMLLADYMLGGGFLYSRLATRIREKDGLSYGVGSYFFADVINNSGNFGVYAISAPENVAKVEKAMFEELERALKDGFTEDEVKQAKDGFLTEQQQYRSREQWLCGTLEANLYYNETMKEQAELEKKVSALTAKQIQETLKKHLDLKKLSVVKGGDFEKKK
jgi:zinc protease